MKRFSLAMALAWMVIAAYPDALGTERRMEGEVNPLFKAVKVKNHLPTCQTVGSAVRFLQEWKELGGTSPS